MFKYEKKKSGAALALVLIVFGILAVLGTAILSLSLSETRQVMHQENNMKAYYAARSAADAMASYIMDKPGDVSAIIDKIKLNHGTGKIDGFDFEVWVDKAAGSNDIVIHSIARGRGAAPQNVSLTLEKTDGVLRDSAIFTGELLDLGNNTTVVGDIGTNASAVLYGNTNTNVQNGKILVGPSALDSTVQSTMQRFGVSVEKLTTKAAFPGVDESKFPVNAEELRGSYNVSGKQYIRVKEIDIGSKNSSLVVSGNGELHILVTDSMTIGGNGSISTINGAKVYFYYEGYNDILFNGNASFQGMIFAPNALLDWKGGSNNTVTGSFFVKKFKAANSNTKIVYDNSIKTAELPLSVFKRKSWGE